MSEVPPARATAQRNRDEVRVYGLNACLALFARRPHDLRKVYLLESRIPQLKAVLAWCVQKKLGYRVVANADLEKLAASQHHEGVCFEARKIPFLALTALVQRLPRAPQPALLVWLDGVGNPHNIGAVLRSAANFGAAGALLSADAAPALSGAAYRVAEGGAEAVPMARIAAGEDALGALHHAGFALAATVPREGEALFGARLQPRVVFALGAEGEGLRRGLIDRADMHLTIPGSGAVESLNVAASAAVLFGEYWRQQRTPRPQRQPHR
ncbi:MAG: rRNA methyltransferase [Xanthomonadaceae bacterium]|nr:rRNA methyltransferase [Xanthomonadaceae bacterium]MDE1960953.1 rRNA methyltransferase [Xanthomonadaceae bacterium]